MKITFLTFGPPHPTATPPDRAAPCPPQPSGALRLPARLSTYVITANTDFSDRGGTVLSEYKTGAGVLWKRRKPAQRQASRGARGARLASPGLASRGLADLTLVGAESRALGFTAVRSAGHPPARGSPGPRHAPRHLTRPTPRHDRTATGRMMTLLSAAAGG